MKINKFDLLKLYLLAICLIVIFKCSAYDIEVDGIYYNIDAENRTVNVAGIKTPDDFIDFVLPSSILFQGIELPVVGIEGGSFLGESKLLSIILPESLTTIGNAAFKNCENLKRVFIPTKVINIGEEIFSGCKNLVTINLPEGLSQIPGKTFYGCQSLTHIEMPNSISSIGSYAFSDSGLQEIDISCVSKLSTGAFQRTNLTFINIPEGVNDIPEYCFYECICLYNIKFPNSLKQINAYAFAKCSSLEKFIIPPSVSKIDVSILWECNKLKELTLGSGLSGLPIFQGLDYKNRVLIANSLGNELDFSKSENTYKPDKWGEYLTTVSRLKIEDSDDPFSINSFFCFYPTGSYYMRARPAFYKNNFEYYYVGRHLKDISFHEYLTFDSGSASIDTLEIAGRCIEVPKFYQEVSNLILGSSVQNFNGENISFNDIKSIICKCNVPPNFYGLNNIPNMTFVTATLYVPKGTKSIYSETNGWKNFWNIVEVDLTEEETGINLVNDKNYKLEWEIKQDGTLLILNSANEWYSVYTLDGILTVRTQSHEIKGLKKGIYIIITDNGQLCKIKI